MSVNQLTWYTIFMLQFDGNFNFMVQMSEKTEIGSSVHLKHRHKGNRITITWHFGVGKSEKNKEYLFTMHFVRV